MSKRDHDRALDRALALASEYRWLLGDGRFAEAEQVERTIDELVGRWTVELDFVWPRSVAERAGVPHVRLASKEASSPATPPSTGNTGAASPRRYGYIIYDADPASGVNPWPSHAGATIEAGDAGEACDLVRDALDVCAAACDSADGYEAGDVLHAIVWDTDGRIVGTLRRVLTAEDL